MPMRSEAQRKYLWAKHPEVAREFEDATPKGKKLPQHVKESHDLGVFAALQVFKLAGEELRLQLPIRKFHGFDAATKSEAERGHKKADAPANFGDKRDSESLEAMLDELDDPEHRGQPDASKDPLDRSTMWGPPSNPEAGDTATRQMDMGVPGSIGMI